MTKKPETTKVKETMKRQGKTGVWTFVLAKPDGKVVACSEWGTNYEFDPRYWEMLPLL